MTRTANSVQVAGRLGVTPTYNAGTAAADGNSFPNDGKTIIEVRNTGGETTLTIQTPVTVRGLAVAERTVVIPATTGVKVIGPFPPDIYNQTDGKVYLDWSQVTGITFSVISVG